MLNHTSHDYHQTDLQRFQTTTKTNLKPNLDGLSSEPVEAVHVDESLALVVEVGEPDEAERPAVLFSHHWNIIMVINNLNTISLALRASLATLPMLSQRIPSDN